MGVTTSGAAISRTARLSVAAGALSAAFAVIGAPTAVAKADRLTCSGREVAIGGTCVRPNGNTFTALGLRQRNVKAKPAPSAVPGANKNSSPSTLPVDWGCVNPKLGRLG